MNKLNNYTYDNLNSLKEVSIDDLQNGKQLASYQYNSFSQRIVKDVNGNKTIFIYNSAGQLLEEINKAQNISTNYIYADGQLIAMVQNGIIAYIVTDHLNAPQLMMDGNGRQIWSAKYEPFGKATITGNIKLNLRADGQYQDDETGLYYNWYRYYNPDLGRYITSDPMGLAAGMNTYIYVNSNPINYTDPMGLRGDGISGSIGLEYTVPYLGIAINGSVSYGYYRDANGNNGHWGGTRSFGIYGRIGDKIFQFPEQPRGNENSLHNPNGLSATGGASVGYFNTNANCISDMYGYSDNYNVALPEALNDVFKVTKKEIPVIPGYQRSVSGNTVTNTYSVSYKTTFGSGASSYATFTWPFLSK